MGNIPVKLYGSWTSRLGGDGVLSSYNYEDFLEMTE